MRNVIAATIFSVLLFSCASVPNDSEMNFAKNQHLYLGTMIGYYHCENNGFPESVAGLKEFLERENFLETDLSPEWSYFLQAGSEYFSTNKRVVVKTRSGRSSGAFTSLHYPPSCSKNAKKIRLVGYKFGFEKNH